MLKRSILLLSACGLALAGCSKKDAETAAPPPADAADADMAAAAGSMPAALDFAAIAAAAVGDSRRLQADRAEDERRKPAAALEFFQAGPGMAIFELEAGGGWYTELLSSIAGPGGSVVMQNPDGFLAFVGEQIDARLKDGRLANVRQSLSNFDALDAADASIDVATWVQGPHELYYTPGEGQILGDPAKSYAEIFRILKPGGVFAVIDHSAVAGAPEAVGHTLHRVDRAVVVAMAEAAGFKLESESDFLANPDDSRTVTVFDPAIRGKTDQFALRFRKPL
ncbi:MAG TPA: SAM-dependent methyltransferase [Parvularcula sp.]|nr:SAM-dependent methyltransferase [Parvularcula sp.]HBS32329.1 SAM-dependent methyltransferase [Parvularcula sp.]